MAWFIVMEVFSVLVEWVGIGRLSEREKDLEILLLRKQLAIMERKLKGPLRGVSRVEKLTLAVLAVKMRAVTGRTMRQLAASIRIVQPETVFKWHRELVRWKWNYQHKRRGGRPRTKRELEQLIVRLARENDWGYGKIQGELRKLGHEVSRETIANILERQGIPPAPERGSISWRKLLGHYKAQILASDFFTVETLCLQTIYVLFFIELGTRRVHVAGCTPKPNSAWATQQGRQMVWELEEQGISIRFLIHDRDSNFSKAFDGVFACEGIKVIATPVRAPNANAYAERWVRSVREECLDKLLVINETHLRRVLHEYVTYYNNARPHQGIDQQSPNPRMAVRNTGPVKCHDVLGGIIHDYYRAA